MPVPLAAMTRPRRVYYTLFKHLPGGAEIIGTQGDLRRRNPRHQTTYCVT
jgi:hypothetical protein